MDVYKLKAYGCSACPVRCGALRQDRRRPVRQPGRDAPARVRDAGLSGRPVPQRQRGGGHPGQRDLQPLRHRHHLGRRRHRLRHRVLRERADRSAGHRRARVDAGATRPPSWLWWSRSRAAKDSGPCSPTVRKRAAERIGKGSEQYAMHVGGREIPLHDPRVTPAMGVFYIADATPAQHCGPQGDGHARPGRSPGRATPCSSRDRRRSSATTTRRGRPTRAEPPTGSC